MSKRWFLMIILLIFGLPSILHAVGMGGFVDEVYIQTRSVGKVLYGHSKHATDCGQCHPKIFKKKKNSNHVNMKAMEKGKSCGACHNGKKAFSVKANCVTCHAGDIFYRVKDPGDVTFPHAAHLESFSCDECHPDLFKAERGANKVMMEEMEEGRSCGACHDGSTAFGVDEDCEACHQM